MSPLSKDREHEKESHRFSGVLRSRRRRSTMELLYSHCAGLDVHKKSVSACIRIVRGREIQKEVAVFGTFTAGLERLCHWLEKHQVSHVAMESTGVFWIPVWNVLERSATRF